MHTNKQKQENAKVTTHVKKDMSKAPFVFGKMNYIFTGLTLIVLVIGFALMSGKGGDIYDFRRITLAPIVVVIGFSLGFVAIFYRPKKSDETTEQ